MSRTTYGDDIGPPPIQGTDSGSVLTQGGGPTGPGPGSDGGGIDFSSGAANPYLPVSAPTPTTGSGSGTGTGTTHSGSTSTGGRHTSSGSSSSSSAPSEPTKSVPTPSSGTTTRQKTVTTILTPHPVRVRFKATNDPGFPGGLPLHFIATAGITSRDRRSHHPSAPHITPHRRF